nr:MAK10-like protein [Tanacetum cinerariifolium]
MKAHLTITQPTQVNKITTSFKICSGPHDTQYCMEDLEQAFVEYASSRTNETGGKWYTFKPKQNNLGDTSNPSWRSYPNLRKLRTRKNMSTFVPGEILAKMEDHGVFTLPCRLGDSEPFDTLANLGSCVNIILLYLFKKLNIGLLEETDHIFSLADGTKFYSVRIVKDVEVHIGKLKLLNDFYVINMKKDPETLLIVGTRFLAIANAVIDYRMAKIAVGEGITRDAELNPFKDTLVFRRMVEFLGAIPINLESNMWESEDLIKNLINWDKPPKNGDGGWHAKIRLFDPDGDEFTKTPQSIPTTRKLFEIESPMEIIDLDHFYDI